MDEESIMQVSCIPNLMERTRVPINFDDEQEDNDFETKNEPVTREETFACIIADDGQCPELKQTLEVRTLLQNLIIPVYFQLCQFNSWLLVISLCCRIWDYMCATLKMVNISPNASLTNARWCLCVGSLPAQFSAT